jgi:hypothetical protein
MQIMHNPLEPNTPLLETYHPTQALVDPKSTTTLFLSTTTKTKKHTHQ